MVWLGYGLEFCRWRWARRRVLTPPAAAVSAWRARGSAYSSAASSASLAFSLSLRCRGREEGGRCWSERRCAVLHCAVRCGAVHFSKAAAQWREQ